MMQLFAQSASLVFAALSVPLLHSSVRSSLHLLLQAVRLESAYPQVTRYMVVVSTNGRQDTEESIVLGMDFVSSDRSVPRQPYATDSSVLHQLQFRRAST